LLGAVVAVSLAGCGGGTKSGGKAEKHITLVMQTPDAPDADAEYFIRQVSERTDGRVKIVEGADKYPSVDPDNEARLVRALRAGRERMAYVPSRAWERASSVRAFRALQAPFLITDYTLLRRITTGPIAHSMLSSLGPTGLVGLGLVPNELRRPLGRKPLTSAATFRGARLRVVTSPTSALALRALGAVPLTNYTSVEVGAAIGHGRLDGVESSTKSIEDNGYVHVAPYLPTNLALFAKTQTIVIRKSVSKRLSADDRAALRAAADATVAHADPASQERTEVRRMCHQGLRLVRAAPADLASLRAAAAPAYAILRRDGYTRAAIRSIERLKEAGSIGPPSLPPCPSEGGGRTGAAAKFPQGPFESKITAEDFRRGHASVESGSPMPFVFTFRNGRWHTNEHPQFGGRYVVHGDEVTFIVSRPLENKGQRETLKWSYFRGELTFKIVDVADAGSRVIYTAHPWRRVG
jgi:TRAP-type C4-dicarboxylate transport system substrate-binding protein